MSCVKETKKPVWLEQSKWGGGGRGGGAAAWSSIKEAGRGQIMKDQKEETFQQEPRKNSEVQWHNIGTGIKCLGFKF